VPIDDENTLSVGWFIDPLPGDEPFEQERIPCWTAPVEDPRTGRWIDSHIMNQDFVAWVGQGRVADRTKEHLGESDRGILMMRKRMFEEMEAVKEGRDPKGTIRDPALNHRVHLPVIRSRPPRPEDGPPPFPFLAGQPQAIVDEIRALWEARSQTLKEDALR